MSSKTDLWYPFFVGDYRRDTARLSCEQHGAYRQLIDEYWITGPLPDDDEILARIVGLDQRTWRKHRPVLAALFRIRGGVWRHKRIDAELAAAGKRKAGASEKARIAAQTRWEKQRQSSEGNDAPSNARSMPQAMLEPCPPPSPSPSPPPSQVVLFPEPIEKAARLLSAESAPKRGARLKPEWTPSADNLTYAVGQGLTEAEAGRLAEDFRDYWTAASGQSAIKLDWSAAWRRWVRTTLERRGTARAPTKRADWI